MFGITDYFVFFCTIGVSFGIGIFFAIWERKKNTPVNYFLAGRNSKTWPVALSFIVTFQSSLMVLGYPAEGYAYGIGIAYNVLGTSIAFIFSAFFIVPVFHPLKLTSVNEYFKLRYGNNSVRYMTLIAGILFSLFYMAIVMVGTCVALEVVLGIPFWGTILIYTFVTTIYTAVGGIKAVIWTDVFQLIVMVTGMIAVLVKSTEGAGGVESVFKNAKNRIGSTSFVFDPTVRYQMWNSTFGLFSAYLYFTLMQPAMQRVYSTPTVQSARNLYFISTPFFCAFQLMASFEGITIFGYFVEKRCDILEAGIIDNINAILPFAVLDLFQNIPGLAGLFTASLSSAALSTMSSCLSSLSAVTYEDIIKVKFPNMQAFRATQLSKMIVLMYGLIALGLAFGVSAIPGSVVSIFVSFMGCFDGPLVATFLLSIMFRRATARGVITGAICGSVVVFWINIGNRFSGVPPYPYLLPGPTDQCDAYLKPGYQNISDSFIHPLSHNMTPVSFTQSLTSMTSAEASTTITTSTMSYSTPKDTSSLSILEKIYSISYQVLSLVGMVTTLVLSVTVSLCTRPPKSIDERCLFSFRKHILENNCCKKAIVKEDTELEEATKFME
ncbi:sodium-coupled monocarboxylate transporter 2-like [Ruditapes philippinarum]|uniref:sodium-coupled monocarboxylate transporter 2-like n=1 Tax=Ruditapes philippinarum TaxID=129788 RepID=UPI00295A8CA0|nr:sodium-coupled monocarboxylate transporter 2-like [Ruditapes philippinarum]